MAKATTLNATAGRTTPINSIANVAPTFALNTKSATAKNTVPDRIVPKPTKNAETAKLFAIFFRMNTAAKNTKPVTALSIMFGTRPAGNVVNKPESTPVANESKNVSFTVGNNKMPMNIIVNMKSGFMPLIIPGVTT